MPPYIATLEFPIDGGDEQVTAILNSLAAHGATRGALDESQNHAAITLHLESTDLNTAAAAALTISDSIDVPLTALYVIDPEDQADRHATWWGFPEVITIPEIAALAGVSRQRVDQWTRERPDFPPSLTNLGHGHSTTYSKAAVTAWLSTARRVRGRPPKAPQ